VTDQDRLAEIKQRLAKAREEQRFYGPHSALKDLDWLVGEVERLRNDIGIRELEVNRAEAKEHDQAMEAHRLRGLLGRLEWAGTVVFDEWYDKGKCCPVCKGEPDEGHAPGCELAEVLGRTQKGVPPSS
jgi:hypothetical protein